MADLSALSDLANISGLELNPGLLILVVVLALWKLIWYGLALYKTINKQQKTWFVVLFIGAFLLNDVGILPIIYLIIHRDKKGRKKK